MQRGFFLTFEGLDGAGKTTQLRRLAAALESRGIPVIVTRQPGGTPLGERIRSLVTESRGAAGEAMDSRAEIALMFADRAQAIAECIQPALSRGDVVLCDRFTDSTEAYQGGGRELGASLVHTLHSALCRNLQPDLTLLLLPSLDASLARARRRNDRAVARRGADEGRFEREGEDFFARVFNQYRAIAAREPVRVVVVDGDRSIEQIHAHIVQTVLERLARHRSA
ncbi:MAG TPA: dTMP kinase [Acidobacteriaceae bacterium]